MDNNMKIYEEKPRVNKNPMGVVSLILSAIGLVGSWIPLLNFISMILAAAGIVVGLISIVMVCLKKAGMVVLPILGLVFGVLTFILSASVNNAVVDQSKKSSAIGSQSSSIVTPQENSSQSPDSATTQENNSQSSSKNENTQNSSTESKEYKVGDAVSWDGKEITVTDVERDYKPKYSTEKNGKEFVKITINIVNKSNENINVSPLNFKIQDSDGAQKTLGGNTFFIDDQLESATLTPGGSKKGAVVFEVKKGDNNLKLICASDILFSNTIEIKL